ncbi:MerR family transcriptional regulator [Apilactobacillus apinorum]|uniref:MerR family transcriptional regulator n=1 Tax=Apilactobacillus apinorum TaxID=1218495 RepID=A0ABP9ZI08_9LACO|nr:MerR family transcriptional regulator [Apilactobacillus apinorum]KOY69687.1 putative transcriptional regulator, MerR family [Apilactobacillus apinorum]CAI2620836.1 Putative transcriptional regulator, MerR family [Apilactobacillus apinorum]
MSGLKNVFPHKMDLNQLIFKIGEVSKMVNVSTRQLRYWEQKGYIESIRDDNSSSRVFNMENLNRVNLIKYYLDEGMTLNGAHVATEEKIAKMRQIRLFMMHAFQDVETIDGKPAVNLGYFDKNKESILYGIIDEQDIEYRVVEKKEEK